MNSDMNNNLENNNINNNVNNLNQEMMNSVNDAPVNEVPVVEQPVVEQNVVPEQPVYQETPVQPVDFNQNPVNQPVMPQYQPNMQPQNTNAPLSYDKKKYLFLWIGIVGIVALIIGTVIILTRSKGKSDNLQEISEVEYQDRLNSYGIEVNKLVTSYYAENAKIPSFNDIKKDLPKSDVTCDKNDIDELGIVRLSNCHIKGIKYRSNLKYVSENIDEFVVPDGDATPSEDVVDITEVPVATPSDISLDNALDAANQISDMANEQLNGADYQYVADTEDVY